MSFFPSVTDPGTRGLAVYNADGTVALIMHDTGTFSGLGPEALFYIGSNFFGNVIIPNAVYNYGDSATFPDMVRNPSDSAIADYEAFGPAGSAGGDGASGQPA